jgi:iron complex transport system substrate-binding protein
MDAHPLPLTRPGPWLWLPLATALVIACLLLGATPRAQSTPAAGTAHRIISLVPAVTEMLFAIGAGADVAGVSSYDTFPAEAATRPKVGALLDPDFEKILSLKPDLVVVYGTQTELITRLTRVSIPMFRYEHAGLPDVTATIRAIGDRVGHGPAGRTLADRIEADLASVRARVAGRPKPRTLLVFGREPGGLRGIYASGGIGFLHDMLETAGGTDVFADIKRQSVQVTTEMLLAYTLLSLGGRRLDRRGACATRRNRGDEPWPCGTPRSDSHTAAGRALRPAAPRPMPAAPGRPPRAASIPADKSAGACPYHFGLCFSTMTSMRAPASIKSRPR